jgi:hypothetical protein
MTVAHDGLPDAGQREMLGRPRWLWRAQTPSCYGDTMKAWALHGVELPFGDEPVSWWIDASGAVHDRPIADAGSVSVDQEKSDHHDHS